MGLMVVLSPIQQCQSTQPLKITHLSHPLLISTIRFLKEGVPVPLTQLSTAITPLKQTRVCVQDPCIASSHTSTH